MVGVCRGLSGLPSPVLFPASFPFVSRSSSFCLQWVLLSCRLQCVSCYKIREVELVTRAVGERSASPAGRAVQPPVHRSWSLAAGELPPRPPGFEPHCISGQRRRREDDARWPALWQPDHLFNRTLEKQPEADCRTKEAPRLLWMCVCVCECVRVSGCEGVWVCITTVCVHGWMSVPVHACVSVCVWECVRVSALGYYFFWKKNLENLGQVTVLLGWWFFCKRSWPDQATWDIFLSK